MAGGPLYVIAMNCAKAVDDLGGNDTGDEGNDDDGNGIDFSTYLD